MDHDELRAHIEGSFGPKPTQARGLTFRLMASCWPGGSHDRTDRWRPEQGAIRLASCSCSTGRCVLCN